METVVQIGQSYHAGESCYTCHSPGPLVDTSVVIEGEGVLALCFACVKRFYTVAGLEDAEEATAEIERLAVLNTKLDQNLRKSREIEKRARERVRPLEGENARIRAKLDEVTIELEQAYVQRDAVEQELAEQ